MLHIHFTTTIAFVAVLTSTVELTAKAIPNMAMPGADMPDMPINVPIDDPNADTEWFRLHALQPPSPLTTNASETPGTTSSANTA